jgi:uncharacterized protein YaaR (DUF327 family)
VPFVKVDKERRTVSGFATLDNIDKHGDIVDTQASLEAFNRFRGNIREMHQPIAVGKVVSFKQENFYDKATKKSYSGVFVDVYVSKGAQDTWEKVLDGTLSGFSIGGSINKSDTVQAHDDYDGPVRVIKDYDLIELSLVDNPANQFANVFSIQKGDIGMKVTGMATEVKALNVFFCDSDEIAVSSEDTAKTCTVCDSSMKNIGWIEQAKDEKSVDISHVVEAYVNKNTVSEGGIEMADELNSEVVEAAAEEVVEETVEAPVEDAPAEEAAPAEETIEKSADPVEEVAEEAAEEAEEGSTEIEKMLDGIKTYITEAITKATDTPGVEEILSQMQANISKSVDEMNSKHESMAKAMQELQGTMAEMSKRMDSYEAATAVKKSSDLETESVETLKKNTTSIWKGHFLGVSDLS